MELILVRHAIAHDHDPTQWPDDSERPLTAAGEKRFEQAAAGLHRVAGDIGAVLCSPFTRAVQTARILSEVAGWPDAQTLAELEPAGKPGEVIAAIEQRFRGRVGVLALVGHEPLLGELAGVLLAGEGSPAQPLRKGGAACFRGDYGAAAGAMTLVWWLPPKVLTKLAPA